MARQKKEYFKKSYKEVWGYLKECKNYILFAIWLFVLFILIGFFVPAPEEISKLIQEFINDLLEETTGLNLWQMIWFIFKNNFISSSIGLLFGVILGIFPMLSAVANGYILGFVSKFVVDEVGYLSLWRMLPHGIFELPAVMISLGLGIKFGMFVFSKKPGKEFARRCALSLKTFLFIILPLLIIAAIIEGTLIMSIN